MHEEFGSTRLCNQVSFELQRVQYQNQVPMFKRGVSPKRLGLNTEACEKLLESRFIFMSDVYILSLVTIRVCVILSIVVVDTRRYWSRKCLQLLRSGLGSANFSLESILD